jgi:transposase
MDGDDGQQPECCGCRQLAERVEQLEQLVEKLQTALEESRRGGKRQAAPFRKPKQPVPKKPGRKPGDDYGTQARRAIPEQIDERLDVRLPECCPHCGCGELTEDMVCQQYQTDIPRKPIHRQFDIHIGHCSGCGERVQGRHEMQTSDALGAAASQLGPDLLAALTVCNKELGLSHGKCRRLVEQLFGIKVSRSANWRAQQRLARKRLARKRLARKRLARKRLAKKRLAKKLRPSYELIGNRCEVRREWCAMKPAGV